MPSVGTLVQQRLVDQRDALDAAEAAVRGGDRSTGVHDLRVAMRRLRSLLATYRPVFDTAVTEPMRDELKSASRRLGEARDAEVATDHTDRLLEAADVGLEDEAVAGLRARLRLDAAAAGDVVEETLGSTRYAAMTIRLDELVSSPPLTDTSELDARKVARRRLRREQRRFAKRVEAARMPVDVSDPDAPHDVTEHGARLHEVRKAAKRVRYAAETARPVTGKKTRQIGKRAKAVQSALGAYHDVVMTRATLRHLALDEAVGEAAAFLLGHLDADEQREMAAIEQRAWDSIDAALA